jgi:hypothetical protein
MGKMLDYHLLPGRFWNGKIDPPFSGIILHIPRVTDRGVPVMRGKIKKRLTPANLRGIRAKR